MELLKLRRFFCSSLYNLSSATGLTLSQTTILDSSKMKEFVDNKDNNFSYDKKMQKDLQEGRKHCGKMRNCSFRAISHFCLSVFKRHILQTCQTKGLFGKGLTLYHISECYRPLLRQYFRFLFIPTHGKFGCQSFVLINSHLFTVREFNKFYITPPPPIYKLRGF